MSSSNLIKFVDVTTDAEAFALVRVTCGLVALTISALRQRDLAVLHPLQPLQEIVKNMQFSLSGTVSGVPASGLRRTDFIDQDSNHLAYVTTETQASGMRLSLFTTEDGEFSAVLPGDSSKRLIEVMETAIESLTSDT